MADFVRGQASYYGPGFQGNRTSQGDVFNTEEYSAAIQIDIRNQFGVPAGTRRKGYARVTNLSNGRSILVKINDVGPLTSGRVIDLSQKAFRSLSPTGTLGPGVLNNIKVEYLGQYKTGNPVGPTKPQQKQAPQRTSTVAELEVQAYKEQIQESQQELSEPQESPATKEPPSPFYTDKGINKLKEDIALLSGVVQDEAVQLDNIVVAVGPPQQTLLDRIEASGITPQLLNEFPQYADLINSYTDKRNSLQELETILENFLNDVDKQCARRAEKTTSWSNEDEQKCKEAFNYSALRALEAELEKQVQELPDPCGKSTISGINNALLNFFETLKTIKKYYNVYVKGVVNRIQNITNLVSRTSQIIASILKLLVQRMRNYILNLLRKLIEKTIDRILNKLSKALKNTFIKAIIDAIICKFNEIIKGLTNLVVDFLYAMIGNVINAPICAVEQFTNALINNLSSKIDQALQPIISAINDVLGGVAQIAGKVFEAIDFILGFEAFLCAKPKCPQIKSWIPGTGVTPSAIEDFSNNFFPIPDASQLEESILGGVDSAIGGLLPGVSIFGDERIEGNVLASGTAPPGVQCFPGAFRCGPPKVEFFGGGGVGAVGNAVVNSIGEVVGVDLSYGGQGYTAPPFVTFKDTCSDGSPSGSGGYGASGYTVINDEGQVVQVVMVNGGFRYLNTPSGITEFGQPTEQLLPSEEVVTREYVTCLDEIQILDTGIGYSPTDTVSITPDVAGLQVKVQITEIGQIVAMEVLSSGCGFGEVPEITINSDTGAGLKVRPVMRFVNRDQYLQEQPDFDPARLIKVIDCVLK